MTDFTVRTVKYSDKPAWLCMRAALFPGESVDELASEIESILDGEVEEYAWIAHASDGRPAGFIEASLRSYAEGCGAGPTPYVEGLWVAPDFRRKAVATALLEAMASWARARGHTEIGSDALIDNVTSHEWHAACGFDEADRIVVFRKAL